MPDVHIRVDPFYSIRNSRFDHIERHLYIDHVKTDLWYIAFRNTGRSMFTCALTKVVSGHAFAEEMTQRPSCVREAEQGRAGGRQAMNAPRTQGRDSVWELSSHQIRGKRCCLLSIA